MQSNQIDAPWTMRALIGRHKQASSFAAVTVAVMVALIAVAILAARGGVVSDSTTCTQWGSANVNQQHTYAREYVKEHGTVPRWGSSPTMVINAINAGCFQAYGEDVSDNTTLLQAISGDF
jgi:Flp pilus assembly pilin Flp